MAQSALVHETLHEALPLSFSFLSMSTFISSLHTRKNGIRCSRKVSYKIDTETEEENLARHNRTNRIRSYTNTFHKREENSIIMFQD